MAPDNFNEPRRDLEIEVGHGVDVDLSSLVSVSQKFSSLIEEVARDYTGLSRSVRWLVEVKPGSVRLPLRGEPRAENVSPAVAHEVGTVIAKGLTGLEAAAERPEHFTDKALSLAKDLANCATEELPIAIWNGSAGGRVTKQLSVNAEKVLGTPEVTFGTIEGRLEALSIHGTKDFSVWPIGGNAIKCVFGSRLDLDVDVLPAVGKRVAVEGKIKTKPNGERVSVEVEELRVIGSSPVAADDVKGILAGYEVADW
ncbi:MAG: hypothetical protein ACTHN7_07580 [Solirubrobacterales bacterium]